MSNSHDDSTVATNPGKLSIDDAKLRALDAELYGPGTLKCGWPLCPIDHPAPELRHRIAEHLVVGDSQPAVVVSLEPLVVSVESDDLDAAVLLRFPSDLVVRYDLAVGTRLLSVNTYADLFRREDAEQYYAVDLVPGPARVNWSSVHPVVAEFVSSDDARIALAKSRIPADEWARLDTNTAIRIERLGLHTARDGRPSRSKAPVSIDGVHLFRTIDGVPLTKADMGFVFVFRRWWLYVLVAPVVAVVAWTVIR